MNVVNAHLTRRSGTLLALPLLLAAILAAGALAACDGTSGTASSAGATAGGGVSASPSATPLTAAPERLAGSDSVAVTQKAVDAYTAAWNAQSVAQLGSLYARNIVFHCHATGVHVDGRAAFLRLMGDVCAMTTGARALAGHADRGWAALELRQDFAGGSIQLLQLIETRGGKIARVANYYQPIESQSSPLRIVNPLGSAPAPADTSAAAEAVALKYAAALGNKDAAAMAALSAPTIAFADTASSTVGSSPGDVQTHYAKIFNPPVDLGFTHLRYAFGPGWAAVVWTAASWSSGGGGGGGVTMLEIRDGKIARETLYYNGSNVPF